MHDHVHLPIGMGAWYVNVLPSAHACYLLPKKFKISFKNDLT